MVELMVVLVIIAIVSAVAVPSYRQYTREGHRAAAQAALADGVARQEQFFLDNKTYTTSLGTTGLNMSNTTAGGHYAISVATPTSECPIATCYLLQATPQGAQTEDCSKSDSITYSSEGEKTPSNCW